MTEWLVNQIPAQQAVDPTTTLSADLDTGELTASFSSTTKLPTAGYTASAVIGYGPSAEIIRIVGGAGNPYTVQRAREGTSSPATWPTGTQVQVVETKEALENLLAEATDPKLDVADLLPENIPYVDAIITDSENQKQFNDTLVTVLSDVFGRVGFKDVNETVTSVWTFAQQILATATVYGSIAHYARSGDTNSGLHFGGADIVSLMTGGTAAITASNASVLVAATRTLAAPKFLGSNFRLTADYVRSAEGLYSYSLVDAIDATQTDFTIQDDTFFAGLLTGFYPRSGKIDHGGGDEEFVVLLSAPTDNGDSTYTWPTGQVVRGRPIGGAVGKAHGAGATFVFTDEREHMDGYVMSPNAPASMAFLQGATLDAADPIRVFVPPRGTTSGWPAPDTGQLISMALKSAYGKTVQLIEPVSLRVLHEFTAATYEATVQHYNGSALDYFPFPGLAP